MIYFQKTWWKSLNLAQSAIEAKLQAPSSMEDLLSVNRLLLDQLTSVAQTHPDKENIYVFSNSELELSFIFNFSNY